MSQALIFKDDEYHFDIDTLKQFNLMDELNYTYLCILLQRARFSIVKAGQHLNAEYEPDFMVYLLKGQAIIQSEDGEHYIDETYKAPLFEKNSRADILFTDDSFLIRIERPLYEIFNKSSSFNRVQY